MKHVLISILLMLCGFSFADSPLTSTPFCRAYKTDKIVDYASQKRLDKKTLKFLVKKGADPVTKIAVVNVLGWDQKGQTETFEAYLLEKRKGLTPKVFDYLKTVSEEIPVETEQTNLLTSDDLMCWAYFQAMENYFHPRLASRAAYLAYVRNPESMAHAVVFTLIACQISFEMDWCGIYKLGQEFLVEKSYEKDQLNEEAIQIILNYLNLYKADC